ncbi:MAG TPA: Ppx/GppA phosphatase family protein [Kiloniellales bacterium]|jgi:exopolyphosphatase/guanosine-5'-triphosphate,3'-diphosphate pyrophosphatase|nr:Ppx/GppA phosphatase family protein [Kiloniellales bacterium]
MRESDRIEAVEAAREQDQAFTLPPCHASRGGGAPGRAAPYDQTDSVCPGHTDCTEPEVPNIYAALDLGTNNCRLLIARRCGSSFRVIDAFSRIVRLGEGLEFQGRLSQAAMDRTVAALSICARKLRYRRAERVRAVATAACRRASNGDLFLRRVKLQTGVPLEVISSEEEATLAYQGCVPLFEPEQPHVVVLDIGGGSTELCWLDRSGPGGSERVRRAHSLPFGVVTLAERYGAKEVSDPVYRAMVYEAAEALTDFDPDEELGRLAANGQLQLVGTSGTVTTLAGVHLGLPRYQRDRVDGIHLSRDTIVATSALVRSLSFQARAAHPCIGVQRADLVIAGCAIVEAVLTLWPLPRLRVADRGLREGMLTRMIEQDLAGAAVP